MDRKRILMLILIVVVVLAIVLIVLFTFQSRYSEENIKIEDRYEAGQPYNRNQLNNFEFEVGNMTEEVTNKIDNIDEFKIQMKEFIYKKGLVQANKAKYIQNKQDEEGNIIAIFKLNNTKETIIYANLKSKEGKYEFSVFQ